jgi:hypothetical protein
VAALNELGEHRVILAIDNPVLQPQQHVRVHVGIFIVSHCIEFALVSVACIRLHVVASIGKRASHEPGDTKELRNSNFVMR